MRKRDIGKEIRTHPKEEQTGQTENRIENEADVDKYIDQLRKSLIDELGKDDVDIVNIEF